VLTPAAQQIDLQEAHRIDVGVAQAYRAPQRFLLRQQLVPPGQVEDQTDAALVLLPDDRKELVVQGRQPRVVRGDLDAGLREHRLDIVDQDAEERPVLDHLPQRPVAVLANDFVETGREAEPARQEATVLRPRENPWNGAQILDAAAVLARGGPRADIEALDHVDRRRLAKIAYEIGAIVDEPLVREPARVRDLLHDCLPLLVPRMLGPRARSEPEDGAERLLEAAHRDAVQAVLGVDRLALLGHPQPPVDGAFGRREQPFGEPSAAAADRSASSVKERKPDAESRQR